VTEPAKSLSIIIEWLMMWFFHAQTVFIMARKVFSILEKVEKKSPRLLKGFIDLDLGYSHLSSESTPEGLLSAVSAVSAISRSWW
jgi:hypothetical protein